LSGQWGLGALALVAWLAAAGCRPSVVATTHGAPPARWWKGNTHTHTLWSDGDDFPEMVADWYRRNGYDFLSITDHNTLADEGRWFRVPPQGRGFEAYLKYRERFGPEWVEERRSGDTVSVRLRRFAEYWTRLDEPGRFLLIPGEEITQYLARRAAHLNGVNLAEPVEPQTGSSLIEMLRKDLDLLRAQEARTGRNVIGVLNHPNFVWSQTAEDILELPELQFFEVYNGHPLVNVRGDALHASTERMWDIVLTGRLAGGGGLLYGVATDDAHDYHAFASDQRNPGRGWVMVRAPALAADALMAAMERGDFYASTGVELADVRRHGRRVTLAIRPQPGVTYRTQFVGTRRHYETASVAVRDSVGAALTRRYSQDVGAVLAEASGLSPSYAMRGDELYVRAQVISSRAKPNPSYAGEVEMAWTQPVRP
jgi:hypothetical protein